MKKTSPNRIQRTLTIDEALDSRLREKATLLKRPISYVVEEAVELYLNLKEKLDR
ncbi:ribbon-helix-helix protein, CopG family [Planktothrix paucivesiculata]|uniref:Ribbon-helix-helix protein CopG domain-containing protein n=1 Tax=Planktothrix paucivesiculata PCC 9631 TaxID=671071 RepID=A0A7Z9BEJ2_9CYAN|nr:ribbon-helix-helix protein, CopG family [Planktothrix paucivesiculata]VXD10636.1 hypothetical protein PL9631_1000001 [Planktothrix paucivesiculata PCC 9631]VXD17180.1 hypothetical protein PL9631_280003 [Planktothrix paucivesiculata PCC 9631]